MTNVVARYPLNLRAMGIYYKNLIFDGQADMVIMGAGIPDRVSERIASHNAGSDRKFSERRLHLDYASCQYYIIRAHLHAGDAEIALRKAETLLGDLLAGRRHGGADAYFTAFLSRTLCLEVLGRREAVEETLRLARPIVPAAGELPDMLDAELALLGRPARDSL